MVHPGTTNRCSAKVFTSTQYEVLEFAGDHCHNKPRFIKRDDVLIRAYSKNSVERSFTNK